jgi:N-methyl-L-proline demethylase
MMSIIEWRFAECEWLGVEFRFNAYAEADDVLAPCFA